MTECIEIVSHSAARLIDANCCKLIDALLTLAVRFLLFIIYIYTQDGITKRSLDQHTLAF